jgi:hypothetical protein
MVWIHDALVCHRLTRSDAQTLRCLNLKVLTRCPCWYYMSSWRHMMSLIIPDLVTSIYISILVSYGPSLPMSMNRSRLSVFFHKRLGGMLFMGILTYCNSLFSHPGSVYPICHALFPNVLRFLLHPSESGKSKKPRVISTGHKKRENRASTVPPTVLSGSVNISIISYTVLDSAEKHSNRHHPLKAISYVQKQFSTI